MSGRIQLGLDVEIDTTWTLILLIFSRQSLKQLILITYMIKIKLSCGECHEPQTESEMVDWVCERNLMGKEL